MHCVACEKLVILTTRKVAGVLAATGDTPTNTVTVYVGGSGEVSLEGLAQAIVAAGFKPGDPMIVSDDRVDELPEPGAPASGATGAGGNASAAADRLACPPLPRTPAVSTLAEAPSVVTAKAGDLATGKVTLGLLGMTCASCAAVIEDDAARYGRRPPATVNLAANTGAVEFDPSAVGIEELVKAVEAPATTPWSRSNASPAEPGRGRAGRGAGQGAAARAQLFIFSLSLAIPAASSSRWSRRS